MIVSIDEINDFMAKAHEEELERITGLDDKIKKLEQQNAKLREALVEVSTDRAMGRFGESIKT